MLTGLYPNSTGILANAQLFRQTIPSAVSLPQAFRLDGYLAVRIGKLYVSGLHGAVLFSLTGR
jgi:iduronate 2-sulfatase